MKSKDGSMDYEYLGIHFILGCSCDMCEIYGKLA